MLFQALKPDTLSLLWSYLILCCTIVIVLAGWGELQPTQIWAGGGQGATRNLHSVTPEGPLLWKGGRRLCMQISAWSQALTIRHRSMEMPEPESHEGCRNSALQMCLALISLVWSLKQHVLWEHRDDIPWHSMRFMCHKADLKFDVQLTWRWIGCHKHWWHHITNDAKYSHDGGDIEQCRPRSRIQSSFSSSWRKS